MDLRLKTADQFFSGDEFHYRFAATATPSDYSRVVFDKLLDGLVEVRNAERPLRCAVFIRRIAGDDKQVLATFRFNKSECEAPLSSDVLSGTKILL